MHPFRKRLSRERELVRLANEVAAFKEPLAGFTQSALERWGRQAGADSEIGRLVPRMIALAAKLRLASGSSHRGTPIPVEDDLIEEEVESLTQLLARFATPEPPVRQSSDEERG